MGEEEVRKVKRAIMERRRLNVFKLVNKKRPKRKRLERKRDSERINPSAGVTGRGVPMKGHTVSKGIPLEWEGEGSD